MLGLMTTLDDVRRAHRDLTDLRREVAAHEHAVEVASQDARRSGASESEIQQASRRS